MLVDYGSLWSDIWRADPPCQVREAIPIQHYRLMMLVTDTSKVVLRADALAHRLADPYIFLNEDMAEQLAIMENLRSPSGSAHVRIGTAQGDLAPADADTSHCIS